MVLRTSGSAVKAKHRDTSKTLPQKAVPVIVLALLAIGLLLYPVAVTQLNNWEQLRAADSYSSDIDNADKELLAQQFAAAQ